MVVFPLGLAVRFLWLVTSLWYLHCSLLSCLSFVVWHIHNSLNCYPVLMMTCPGLVRTKAMEKFSNQFKYHIKECMSRVAMPLNLNTFGTLLFVSLKRWYHDSRYAVRKITHHFCDMYNFIVFWVLFSKLAINLDFRSNLCETYFSAFKTDLLCFFGDMKSDVRSG